MDAIKMLKSYNLNESAIEYYTNENHKIESVLNSLDKREKDVLVMTYIHQLPLTKILTYIKYKDAHYYRIKNAALKKIDTIINSNKNIDAIDPIEFVQSYLVNIDVITYLTSMNDNTKKLLDTLNDNERQVLCLKYLEELTYEQMCNIMKCTERSVSRWKKSGLDKIDYILSAKEAK